ncbi:MAG: trypsin-like peptidase domain-containing protein [Candidatus Krumholzibacteriia bacterium]
MFAVKTRLIGFLVAGTCTLLLAGAALAGPGFTPAGLEGPVALAADVQPVATIPVIRTEPVNVDKARQEDSENETLGLPPRFALPEYHDLTPETSGVWEDLDERWVLWRQRIEAPGAVSVNLGFTRYRLPKGGRLALYPADMKTPDDPRMSWVFTEQNNEAHGELWTPVVLASDVIVELLLPRESRHDYELRLQSVNKGYRFFGEDLAGKSGSCNIDVVCPEGADWWSEINSVGVYTLNGSWTCTGAMINNTAEDQTPYFLTANHCSVNTSNDQTMVVYWNFQSPVCGQQGGGSLADFQTGATFLATSSTSDFCLVELNAAPDPAWGVTYAGWNRASTNPGSAVAIHHPSTDEKSISFENDPVTTTTYLQNAVPGDGTHIRVTDWDLGTTEPGSSGSPLFNPDHQIIGQLHGGYAACGNDLSDWYGRFSVTWPNVSSWLDPLGGAPLSLDTLDPYATDFQVSPGGNLDAAGNQGGPFTPSSLAYTLENQGAASLSFQVSVDVPWVDLSVTSGSIPAGGSMNAIVSINAAAGGLAIGSYTGTVTFSDLTNGVDVMRGVNLQVGVPEAVYTFNFDGNPSWTMDAGWEFGVPLGGGGQYGGPDPVSGYTGPNVIGYNLAGDYPNSLPERMLVSTPIDCTDLTAVSVKFQRWLGVEQPSYDHAWFKVSTDGVNFTTVWTNGGEVADAAWTQVEYDISAIADNQPTVYLAWVMGTTDSSWQYCGWNIDDVEIWGLQGGLSPVAEVPGVVTRLGNHPNPFNPLTKVSFTLDRAGEIRLAVYDVQGRLVRTLLAASLESGDHSVVWNGLDDHGRHAGSGVYFARMTAGDQVVDHKMVLLK